MKKKPNENHKYYGEDYLDNIWCHVHQTHHKLGCGHSRKLKRTKHEKEKTK